MVYPPAKTFPKSRWMTVIETSCIQPQEEFMRKSKKLSKYFKRLHKTTLKPSPGQRWMNYSLNSGQNRVIEVCKSYMGDDDTVVIDCINAEMIDLGNKPHGYSLDETLDKFFPDYYIKYFLMNSLDATSLGLSQQQCKDTLLLGVSWLPMGGTRWPPVCSQPKWIIYVGPI